MTKTVVGLYDELSEARAVVEDLANAGFDRNDISLVASDPDNRYGQNLPRHGETTTRRTETHGSEAGTGAATGAVAGGILGGLGGILVGLGALVIPGVGPIIAAGPIVAGLTGAGIGAVAGGLIGALIGWGIPEEEAHYYAEGIRRGSTLVAVKTADNKVDDVTRIMNRHNPIDIEQRAAEWREEGWSGFDTDATPATTRTRRDTETRHHIEEGKATIPVVEEELRVGKRQVERGGVHVRTYVHEKPVEETVTLREEHVKVERRPANRPASPEDFDTFEEGTMELTETAEEAVAEKRARVVEEVVIGKEVGERTEKVKDTVRHTHVDVEETAHTDRFKTYNTDFQRHFNENYASTGRTYRDYEPAYRYGYTLSTDQRYRGRNWNEIEPEARRRWETEHRDKGTWEEFKDSVRHAWNRAKT